MVLQKMLRMGEGRRIRQLERLVAEVNEVEDSVTGLTDTELAARTEIFKQRLAGGETLDDLMPEADDKVGRNDPCPAGSGLKYKKRHGA